eukprot:13806366-Alexandrium_andersonii.AAC.1
MIVSTGTLRLARQNATFFALAARQHQAACLAAPLVWGRWNSQMAWEISSGRFLVREAKRTVTAMAHRAALFLETRSGSKHRQSALTSEHAMSIPLMTRVVKHAHAQTT